VSFLVCVALCALISLIVVGYFVSRVFLCIVFIVVITLSQGEKPFAVQLNNNSIICIIYIILYIIILLLLLIRN
jgi:hypothetical protein